jgi:hypothetical protein
MATMTTSTAVCGIYCDRHSTENAVETLRASGFRETDISALFPDQLGTKKFLRKKQTRLLHGVVVGGGIGALMAVLWWSEGSSTLTTIAHPLLTTLVSLGAGVALGSFIGGLVGVRIPKSEEHYEGRVRRGDVLLAVHCDSPEWAKKAALILKRTKATDVSTRTDSALDLARPVLATIRPAKEETVAPALRTISEPQEVRKSAA